MICRLPRERELALRETPMLGVLRAAQLGHMPEHRCPARRGAAIFCATFFLLTVRVATVGRAREEERAKAAIV